MSDEDRWSQVVKAVQKYNNGVKNIGTDLTKMVECRDELLDAVMCYGFKCICFRAAFRDCLMYIGTEEERLLLLKYQIFPICRRCSAGEHTA